MSEKTEPFSWRLFEYEIAVKYLKKLAMEKICCILNDVKYSIWSSLDFEE